MAKNDATTNDEATKAAAAANKTADTAEAAKADTAGKAADTDEAGQAGAPANAPDTAATASAPGAAAQPPAERATQEDVKRKPVAIEVISRAEGFWRGDRQWTIAPQTVPLWELSHRQLDEIEDEPLLITRYVYEDGR